MVALGKIEVSIEALRSENLLGQSQHEDYEARLRDLERVEDRGPDHEARLRSLERVRWALYGAAAVLGGGITAAGTQIFGG